MEQQNQIQEIVEAAILNLRQVAEVNTIIGQPILTSMGATILPVSQVTLGFVAGGGEYGNSEKIAAVKGTSYRNTKLKKGATSFCREAKSKWSSCANRAIWKKSWT